MTLGGDGGCPPLWFFGAGRFAARCLSVLSEDLTFDLVVTSPPSRGGRGMKLLPSPVDEVCRDLGITSCHSSNVACDDELLSMVKDSPPMTILVVDFGQKIPEPYLSAPREGCLNIHPSLLPRYRGAAPVQRAIMNGDEVLGVALFRLVEKMDAGPVLFRAEYQCGAEETAGEVLDILAEKGSELFLLGVKCMLEESCTFKEQDCELASYAPKISNNEAQIAWTLPAKKIVNYVRGLNPAPGAFLFTGKKRLKIWTAQLGTSEGAVGEVTGFFEDFPEVGTSDGSVILRIVQPEGKGRMTGSEWARGLRLKKGDFLQ